MTKPLFILLLVVLSSNAEVFAQDNEFGDRYSDYFAPLYYNATSGNVTIDLTEIPGGIISGYGMTLTEPIVREDNFTPFMGSAWISLRDNSLGENNFAGVAPGVYSLGEVFPIGMSEFELNGLFVSQSLTSDSTSIVGPLGFGQQHRFTPVHSPSPLVPINVDASTVPTHERWATEATLNYDPSDGTVVLDTTGPNGGAIASYVIESELGKLISTDFAPLTSFSTISDSRIFELGAGGIPEGSHELGTILPPGLTDEMASDFVTSAVFIGFPGHKGDLDVASQGVTMGLAVVPEPSFFTSLLTIGMVLLLMRRRASCGVARDDNPRD